MPTTTDTSITVVDGAIKDAVVCVDKNANGKCDADETQGTTDAAGHVTLAVPNADVGKYPIVAVIDTTATDADHGPVTVAYTMSAPADQPGVVSPLTTLVQQTVATTGASTSDAAKSVQDATGLTVSLFQDYTKIAAPTDGSISAAAVARLLVVTTQQQTAVVAATLGTTAIDGSTISKADLDKVIQKKLLELVPELVSALNDPAVLAATTPADKEAALLAAANALVAASGLSPAAIPTVVAVNNQNSTPGSAPPPTPGAFLNLHSLNFTNAANFFVRTLGGSASQNTPDANNNIRYVERRQRNVAGNLARWGSGSDPWRGADLSWNGSAWANCPINFENTSSVRDAFGNSTYTYCGRESGKTNRASFDVSGKTMIEVYDQARAAGYTNLTIADTAVLANATFPPGSFVFYQTNTPLTESVSYYPAGGTGTPAGTSNVVSQYSSAVSAGGIASTQAAGTLCNSAETTTNGTDSTTLEGMIAAKTGTPCIYGPGSFVYNGVTYTSGAKNEWWSNSTVSLGKLGTVALNSGTAPGFYSGNTLLRIAFQGTGTNPVTYYACQERFNNGSTRNCTAIGTGSYTITTLGDARVMTFSNAPAQAAALNYNRVFVERGGFVYFGYQSKPIVTNSARLNMTATTALLTQLGLATDDPSVPWTLSAASYQGTWDFRDAASTIAGTTVFIRSDGNVSCQDRTDSSFYACALTVTDANTGAFTYTNSSGGSAAGIFNFTAGTASGTFHDPTNVPVDNSFVGQRR